MHSNYQKILTEALHAFQAGHLPVAESKAGEALLIQPRSSDALHLLGVIRGLQKNHSEAENLLRKAAQYDSKNNFICFNLAKALSDQGKNSQAIEWHKKALKLAPKHDMAWLNYGKSLYELGDISEAIKAFEQARAVNSFLAEAYANIAICFARKERFVEALQQYDRAINLKPKIALFWNGRGDVLGKLERYEEALSNYRIAIELDSNDVSALNSQGIVLNSLRRYEESLASFDRVVSLDPRFAEGWSNRGNVLINLRRYQAALESCNRAISIDPGYVEAWSNRGNSLSNLNRFEESIDSYEQALKINPEYAEVRYNQGLAQLLNYQFEDGFRNCLWRWKKKQFITQPLETDIPKCEQGELNGEVLFWAEQGLGDEIFYSGLLPLALASELKLTLALDERLHSIYRRSFPSIRLLNRKNLSQNISGKIFDRQAPIGDLGYLLNLNKNKIEQTRQPFLVPDWERVKNLKLAPAFNQGKPVCGVAWRSQNKDFGAEKSAQLIDFSSLLTGQDFTFVNLQYGNVDQELEGVRQQLGVCVNKIEGLDLFDDIEGVLALIEACDFMITTSNVTAHLAGSIGKRGCVLVPKGRGRIWYWHHNDEYSLWYPNLRIFYQAHESDWQDSVDIAARWLYDNFRNA